MNLIAVKAPCPHKAIKYSAKYDAKYCLICNTWTEDKCKAPYCEYCFYRPEKPN